MHSLISLQEQTGCWVMDLAILKKLQYYCAYQERCHEEVRTKLLSYKVYGQELEEVIAQLVQDDFLNEERFAKAYARGKFRIKQWGRNRIRRELKFRKISDYCIQKGMAEIDEEEYVQTLDQLLQTARQEAGKKTPAQRYKFIMERLLRKGYESNLIKERWKD
jgi:regulatory protein